MFNWKIYVFHLFNLILIFEYSKYFLCSQMSYKQFVHLSTLPTNGSCYLEYAELKLKNSSKRTVNFVS